MVKKYYTNEEIPMRPLFKQYGVIMTVPEWYYSE